jgi:hypothetical protein
MDGGFRDSVFDATRERLARACVNGEGVTQLECYDETGKVTARRRKIERPLDAAARYGWIKPEHKQAGEEFARYMIRARSQIGFTTSSWREQVDGSGNIMNAMDRRRFYEGQLRRALHAIHPKCRQKFLDWMVDSEQTDVSVRDLGAKFTRHRHDAATQSVGQAMLELILEELAQHFGFIQAASSWETRRQLDELLSRNGKVES